MMVVKDVYCAQCVALQTDIPLMVVKNWNWFEEKNENLIKTDLSIQNII